MIKLCAVITQSVRELRYLIQIEYIIISHP